MNCSEEITLFWSDLESIQKHFTELFEIVTPKDKGGNEAFTKKCWPIRSTSDTGGASTRRIIFPHSGAGAVYQWFKFSQSGVSFLVAPYYYYSWIQLAILYQTQQTPRCTFMTIVIH
jgi:hypothetical protein